MVKKNSAEDFLDKAREAGQYFAQENLSRLNSFEQGHQPELMDKLLLRYSTEGYSGGNYSDGVAQYYSNDLEDRISSAESDLGIHWQFQDKIYQFNALEFKNYIKEVVTQAEEEGVYIAEETETEYYGNNTTRRLIAGDIEQLRSFFGNSQVADAFMQGFYQAVPELKVQLQIIRLEKSIQELKRDYKKAERDVLNHESNMQEQDKRLLAEKKSLLQKIAQIDAHFENQNSNHMKKLIEVQQKFATINEQLEQAKKQHAALTGKTQDGNKNKPGKKH